MTQPYQFVRISLSPSLLDEAALRANSLPIYKRSSRGLQANQVGCIGEVVVEQTLRDSSVSFKPVYLISHDLEIDRQRVEVKTKDRGVAPVAAYECSVPSYNAEAQNPDMYIFVSLQRNQSARDSADIFRFHTAWIVGWATAEDIHVKAVERKAGTTEPNGVHFFTDCRNLFISQLRPIAELLRHK